MSVPTAAEQLLLDNPYHRTELYLSIFEPELAMICQVTGSYSTANQTIDYYNPVSGTSANVTDYHFQVALIGTSPNSEDIGRTWVRSATASTIRFVESDHIDWSSATYITILKYTEIIPVFPRIIQDPSNEENVIFYKIWDVAYTDQNSILGTFVCMGSHYAGFRDPNSGEAQVYWSASGTSNVIGDNLTYLWEFEGGDPTGSTSHTPGNVSYDTPGHYRTLLTTTSDSGREDTSIRYVSIYDRPGNGNNPPILKWEFMELGGNRDSIGYNCRIKVQEHIEETKLRDGSLVIIFGDDYYGNVRVGVNNSQTGRSTIKFVGYVVGGTVQYNYETGYVEFEAVSPTKFMEMCEGFSCSVESKTAPTTWYELLNMNIQKATYHYLAWQSSVLLCTDVEFENFTDQYIQYFDADRTSLYDAINSVVDGARRGKVVSDRLGKIWIEQEYSVIANAATALNSAMTINKMDWIGEPVIEEKQQEEVSYIETGGIGYDPASSTSVAYLCGSPGSAPGYRGKQERKQGLALADQNELNQMAGDLYANMNAKYPRVDIQLRGNFNNLDIAPQEKVSLNVAIGDTPRRIIFTNKAFAIRGVDWRFDAQTQMMLPTISLTEIVDGFDATTIIIPVNPPETTGNAPGCGGSYTIPPFTVPTIPTTLSISGGGTTGTSYNDLEAFSASNALVQSATEFDVDGYLIFDMTHYDSAQVGGGLDGGSQFTLPEGTWLFLAAATASITGPGSPEENYVRLYGHYYDTSDTPSWNELFTARHNQLLDTGEDMVHTCASFGIISSKQAAKVAVKLDQTTLDTSHKWISCNIYLIRFMDSLTLPFGHWP